MFKLELTGFCKSKRIDCPTIEGARAAYLEAKAERWTPKGGLDSNPTRWNMWELFEDGNLVAEGTF